MFWYQAPSWTPHRFRELHFTSNYIDAFSDLPLDVDGDGRTDLVTVSWFAKRIAWYRNPGRPTRRGSTRTVDSGFSVEFAILADLDNDGKAREVLPQFGDTKAPLAWYEAKNGAWVKHVAAPASFGHGIGAGDVNGDGRTDILTKAGWLEAPADPRSSGWTHHADWNDAQSLGFLYTIDLTGDGKPEILTMAGHDYGIHYYERGADGAWARRVIDDAWSQAHASTLVDLDGDKRLDLVTGKRFMAHNGKDPGEKEPLGVYWYQFRPDDKGRPEVDPARDRLRRPGRRRHADSSRRHRRRRRRRPRLRRQERTLPAREPQREETSGALSSALRAQPLDRPAVSGSFVPEAVVETERTVLPELDPLRRQPEAAPMRRPRHVPTGEAGFDLGDAIHQRLA
jgi:hypothetical protein